MSPEDVRNMDQKISGNEMLKRYLLGELPRYQRKQIEREFFNDTDFLKRLLDAERKLISDYDQGTLDARDRLLFERQFPGGFQKSRWINENQNELAQVGLHKSDAERRNSSWWAALLEQLRKPRMILQFAVAGAIVLLAAVLFGIFVWSRDPNTVTVPRTAQSNGPTPTTNQPSPDQQSSVPTPEPRNSSSPRSSPSLTPRPKERAVPLPPAKVVVATLVPGLKRGNATTVTVTINPDDTVVRLQLKLYDNKHESYSADLRNKGSRLIKQLSVSRPQMHDGVTTVNFEVSASLLIEDFYYLTLYGKPPQGKRVSVDTYPFIVERK